METEGLNPQILNSQVEFEKRLQHETKFIEVVFGFNLAIGHQMGFPKNQKFEFIRCKFKSILIQHVPQESIVFDNCSSDRGLTVHEQGDLNLLTIIECKNFGLIRFINGGWCKEIIIEKSICDLTFSDSNSDNLNITESIVKIDFISLRARFGNVVVRNKSIVCLKVIESLSGTIKEISIIDSSVDQLLIQDSTVDFIQIIRSKMNELLIHNELYKVEDRLFASDIDLLQTGEIRMKSTKISSLTFNGGSVKDFDLSKYSKQNETVFNFYDLSVGELNLKGFVNKGKFDIHGVIIDNLVFNKTMLDRCAVFNDVTLNKLTLIRSDIFDCRFTNIKWPNNFMIDEEGFSSNDLSASYNQLHRVVTRQLSPIEEVDFRIHERRIFLERTKVGLRSSIISKMFWDSLGNYLILWTDKSVSNFGQNIWRSLVIWCLFFHPVLLSCLWYEKDIGIFFSFSPSFEETVKGVGLFLNLLNPVHSSTIYNYELAGISDFFLRLASAYFLFSFLRVTRKFHIK